jgi:hypothetical protein
MLKDRYNYKLNGIEHEIILNNNIKINIPPINDKILMANKFMLKYINDLFTYYNIEYTILNNTLLGQYVFQGINIFDKDLEIGTSHNNLFKIKKLEDEIKEDGLSVYYMEEKYIKISTTFINKTKTSIYIYLFNHNTENDTITYTLTDNSSISHRFYDIFPLQKGKFEEFEISIPHKLEKILESFSINLNYIVFTDKKDIQLKIIDEKTNDTIYEKFISIIKPFLF